MFKSDYYADAVMWVVDNKVTSGTGDGSTFSPAETCTRGQIVTFLWRAMGSPKVSIKVSFSDVTADTYYEEAVKWAVSKQITSRTGDGTTFSSAQSCARGQIVTFLYRNK